MTISRRVFLIGGFAALLALAILARGRPPVVEQPARGEAAVVAATFASAFCGSCAILKPKLARILPDYASAAIDFVEFDFTTGASDALREKAAAKGVLSVYDASKGATGFTMLVDAASGEVLGMLTAGLSEEELRAEIDAALRNATHTEQASPAPGGR